MYAGNTTASTPPGTIQLEGERIHWCAVLVQYSLIMKQKAGIATVARLIVSSATKQKHQHAGESRYCCPPGK